VSRFKRAAHGLCYRRDGALMAVGDADGRVKLFDALALARSSLRDIHAHEGFVSL
jgi:hypothetical protein